MSTEVLVLGIGNILWADEGFGIRCVEELDRLFDMAPGVEVLDGGTQGLYLVHRIREAKRLIVFDAIDYGVATGTLKLVRDGEVPKFHGVRKMSLHQTGFQDVLSAADLLGGGPASVLLIGVQAGLLDDYGGSLTPEVRAQVDPALRVCLDQLADWGLPAVARAEPKPSLMEGGLDWGSYEAGRPSAQEACRFGDARFLSGVG